MFGLCADNWESLICCGQYTSRAPTAHAQDIYKWLYFYLYIKPLFYQYTSSDKTVCPLARTHHLDLMRRACEENFCRHSSVGYLWNRLSKEVVWTELPHTLDVRSCVCTPPFGMNDPDFIEIKATGPAQGTFSTLVFMEDYKTEMTAEGDGMQII